MVRHNFCPGKFSAETKQLLNEKFRAGEVTFTETHLCEICGVRVIAESKSGEWVPVTHKRPLARRSYKGSGSKR